MPGFAGVAVAVANCSEAAMPCGSEALDVVEAAEEVADVGFVEAVFDASAGVLLLMADCEELREKVLLKGAPR